MSCFDFPGGIGTASRAVGDHHVGVLLLCNFGDREYLDLLGSRLDPVAVERAADGSCIAVCATDAPLSAQQLRRLALRPLLGLARAGSYASQGSGEIGLAFSTSHDRGVQNADLNPYFAAAYEAAHEAVYNCLVAARPARAPRRHDAGRLPDRGRAPARPRPRASAEMTDAGLRDEVVGLAQALIRLDTSNPPGNETPAAELLADYLGAAGVDCELVGPDPERLNLVARLEGRGEAPSLMLLAHTDVVPAPSTDWTVATFRGASSATAGWSAAAPRT